MFLFVIHNIFNHSIYIYIPVNGCGVHIHNGTSCGNTTTQGGHYFVSPVTIDPWIEARYKTNEFGLTLFADTINMGTDQINGRAFIGKWL